MERDTLLPFLFPAVARKKVCVAFDGGMLSSDGGVLLQRNIEKQLGIAEPLSRWRITNLGLGLKRGCA
jgi:hypothetical protein